MLLQGNLQVVFDALYNMGVIDPVLDMDWTTEMEDMSDHYQEFESAVVIANEHQFDEQDLIDHLGRFESKILNFLAMEVAREFADFHAREQVH